MSQQESTSICPACGSKASGKFCETCGTALGAAECSSCGAPLKPGARFCRECGAPSSADAASPARPPRAGHSATTVATAPSGGSPIANYAPWGMAAILLIAVVAYFSGQSNSTATEAVAPAGMPPGAAPFANGGGGASGAPPDISNMSPRERADRLYNRIMRYVEEGKKDSASFFAPMAMASFDVLGPELDTDARYDYGRVASETGSYDVAFAQADTILKALPDHLLALSLQARTHRLKGDASAAAASWKRFLAVKDAQLKKNLPEYQAHATDIEQATMLANGK